LKLYKRILRHPFTENLIVTIGAAFLKIIKLTIPFERINFEEVNDRNASGESNIYAFWHGRMFMMPFAYSGGNVHVLISLHSDGSLISKTVGKLGIHSVRGSSSKGAVSALKEMYRLIKKGKDIAFTPDGPRGPGEYAQMGALMAAKLSGIPVYPVSFSTSRRKILNTWDRFLIPYPFSRGVFICGKAITVPRDADNSLMESKRLELQNALTELGEEANNYYCGDERDC